MIHSDTAPRRSEQGLTPLAGRGAGMAAGWRVRSRVVDCHEEDDGRLTLRIHGPFA